MTVILLVAEQIEENISLFLVSDLLVSRNRSQFYQNSLESLVYQGLRGESDLYTCVDYMTKSHKITETLGIVFAGSILASGRVIREIESILTADTRLGDIRDLCDIVCRNLGEEYISNVSFILFGSEQPFLGYQSKNCKTICYGNGLSLVYAGTGGNFVELSQMYPPDVVSTNRVNMDRTAWNIRSGRLLSEIIVLLFYAEFGALDFKEYATGGWFEITTINEGKIAKVSSTLLLIDFESATKNCTLLDVKRLAYDGQRPVVVRAAGIDFLEFSEPKLHRVETTIKQIHANTRVDPSKGYIEIEFPDFFVGTGFGNYSADFGTFCVAFLDGKLIGVELVRKNPVNFSNLTKIDEVSLKSKDTFLDSWSQSLISHVDRIIREREEAT